MLTRVAHRSALYAGLVLVASGCGAASLAETASPGPPATTLEVTCGAGSTEVDRDTVAAGSRGIPVSVSGSDAGDGLYLAYSYPGPRRGESPGGGEPVPTDGDLVLLIPPGVSEVACQANGGDLSPPVTITVVDPDGHYRQHAPLEAELDCDQPGMADSALLGTGDTATAAALDFADLVDAELGDRGAGYAEQNLQEFPLTRQGRAVGTTQAFLGDGRWTASWNYVCS